MEIGYICITNPKDISQVTNHKHSISNAPIIQCYYKGLQFVSKEKIKKETEHIVVYDFGITVA